MAEYCSSSDLKNRATANGWKYAVDRDQDGRANTVEAASETLAIQWAGDEIDIALVSRIEPDEARAQSNRYLRNLAVDLALWRLFSNGGDDVPASLSRAYDEALEKLERLKGGETVPGLTFNPPYNSAVPVRVPRGYMPRGR